MLNKLRSLIPTKIPTGKTELEAWIDRVLGDNKLPVLDSYRHAIATMILHLPPTQHKVATSTFVASVKKAMANQVAYDIIQDIKNKPQPEATTETSETPQDGPQPQTAIE